ncbi:MAG: glycosyltransferase [Candidatus Pacebacteria bacterium]|nr:glycosyltransferase [Candidatus Paceibacterota bacterium]
MQSTEKKKILYVITKSNWGGAQRYVYDLATEVSKKSAFDISVALGGSGTLKKRLEEKKIPVISLSSLERNIKPTSDVKVFFELISLFRKEKPDVIHLNSSKTGVIGALSGRIMGCKKILFTAHGWAHTEERPLYQKVFIKTLHWFTVVLSHKTITVSEKTKNELADTPFVKNKLIVIHNGITEPNFYERDISREKISGQNRRLPNNAFVIGTIAELHKNKGLVYAIEAFSSLLEKEKRKNVYLVLIGSGEEKKDLHDLVKQKNIGGQTIFFESNCANKYLKAFDVFILPSIKEGLPYTILEAGLAKLPVVASYVGGIHEIIEDKRNGFLIQPRNTYELQKKLEFLLHNKQEGVVLGEKLFKHVKTHFSTQTMVEKTIVHYN